MEKIKFNEEQETHWEKFLGQQYKISGLHQGLTFFEKKLGLVNADVVEYRKILRKEEEILNELGDMNETLGISDILSHNLSVAIERGEV